MSVTPHLPSKASLALAGILLAACGSSGPQAAGSSDRIEAFIADELAQSGIETRDRVTKCARLNGLDGYIELSEGPTVQYLDPAPELEGRAWVQEVGTGRIAIQKLKAEVLSAGPPPDQYDEPTPNEAQILDEGPISDPDTSRSRPFGCRTWAALGNDTANTETLVLAADYSAWMEQRYEASPEYVAIQRRQFTCVSEAGYPSVASPDDLDLILEDALENWQSGRTTYEEALEIDRRVGLVYYDCYSSVEQDFDQLADQVAAGFLEAHDLGD